MKRVIFTAAMLSAVLIGCKENNKQNESEEVQQTELQESNNDNQEVVALNNDWLKEIQLDDEGQKWIANIETTQGVDEMAEIIENNNPKTVEDYRNLASKLNDKTNFIVKECTMEGPSHDNLHVFLHPLIKKVGALLEVESAEKGQEILKSIEKNIEEYYNYFQ